MISAALEMGPLFSALVHEPDPIRVSQWMSENIVLVDGPEKGRLWSARGAPYLAEIADLLSEEDPCTRVTVRKSEQTGVSILALAWCLYIADRVKAEAIYAAPNISMLKTLNGQKLEPLIKSFEERAKRQVFIPQTSRNGQGSTATEKRFPGGYISMVNANSAKELSSKTAKYGIKDELSKWETIAGADDPETLFFGRFTAFQRSESYKILELSTPEIDMGGENGLLPGHCRIDRAFQASDQRYWNVPCPACGTMQRLTDAQLRVDEEHPERTVIECLSCGHGITEPERVRAVREGEWIATARGPDRHPGFHIDAFISLMMSLKAIALRRIGATSEEKKKNYANLVLGLPHRYAGIAPDFERLLLRREPDLMRGHVPPRGLILTCGVDVQMRGIWYEIVAFAPDRQSWTVDIGYIDGDTATSDSEVWRQLMRETVDRSFPDAFGGERRIDAMAIDTGYRSNVVYDVVRRRQRLHPDTGKDILLAVDGLEGWSRPAIGTPTPTDIDLDGVKIKEGCRKWPVGTYGLKSDWVSELNLEGIAADKPADPPGYPHFGSWLDKTYFLQITAEQLIDVRMHDVLVNRKWTKTRDNHLLDCRIYAKAMAEYLGLSTMTADDWAVLAERRGVPKDGEPTLFTAAAERREKVSESSKDDVAQKPETFLARRKNFLGRTH